MPKERKIDYSALPLGKPGRKEREPRKEARARKRLNPVNRERRDWLREDQYGEAAVFVRAMHCVGCCPKLYQDPASVMRAVASAYLYVQEAIGAATEPPVYSDPHHVRHRSDSDARSLVPCCRIHHQQADEHQGAFERCFDVDLDCIARWIAGPVALLLGAPDPEPDENACAE